MSTSTGSAITLTCPGCSKKLRVATSAAGKNGKCPACQSVFTVPKAPISARSPLPAPTVSASAPVQKTPPPIHNDLFDSLPDQSSALSSPAASTFPDLTQPPSKVKYTKPHGYQRFGLEKHGIEKGVIGGLVMMGLAVTWFVVGLMFDRIFFYPPILFLIGAYGFVKGLMTGNIAGRK